MSRIVGISIAIQTPGRKPSDPDTVWTYWEGGEVVAGPGRKYYTEIVLRGPMTSSRSALSRWINEVGHGKFDRRDVTITEIVEDGDDGKTYVYRDCFPTGYVFPRLSVTNTTGNVMEEVRLKPNRCELK